MDKIVWVSEENKEILTIWEHGNVSQEGEVLTLSYATMSSINKRRENVLLDVCI